MEERYVVTSYENPNLDVVASIYAYKEFIEKCDRKSAYYIVGNISKEVQVVCNKFDIKLESVNKIEDTDNIILVGMNNTICFYNEKSFYNVTEIIDNYKNSGHIEKFTNANVHIEFVGAVATLVAERFREYNIEISEKSAILLYYGIASSTTNFKSKTTTSKDVEIANWLKSKYNIIDNIL